MSKSIGDQLSSARLHRNLSIEQVSKATHLRPHAIEMLEADDFESFPSTAQARGFLRIYADFLELSLQEMLSIQKKTNQADTPSSQESHPELTETSQQISTLDQGVEKRTKVTRKKKQAIISFKGTPTSLTAELPVESVVAVSNSRDTISSLPGQEPSAPEEIQLTETQASQTRLQPSQKIFTEIGEELSQRRQTLSINLDEIENHIHVRRQHLEYLEAGQFSKLPSSVQARGMLNNFARFLDLDVDAIMLKYAGGLQARLVETQAETVEQQGNKQKTKFPIKVPLSIRRFLTMDTLIGLGVVIALAVFAIWGIGYLVRENSESTPEPTAPSISDILLSSTLSGETSSTSEGTSQPAPLTPEVVYTPITTISTVGTGPVQVVLVSTRSVWVKVIVDNVVKFTGRTEVGLVYSYNATTQIEVVVGDGSAVSIIYNQADLGPMGGRGEFVDRIYTATAILVPTPTATPTATITLTPTITPRPSATSRNSPIP